MHPGWTDSTVQLSDLGARPWQVACEHRVNSNQTWLRMMLFREPRCSPSIAPSPTSCSTSLSGLLAVWAAAVPTRLLGGTVGQAALPGTALCSQVVAPICSCGPQQVTCAHIWKCTCGRLRTPYPSSNVFNSKPALCHCCAFKEPCVSPGLQ